MRKTMVITFTYDGRSRTVTGWRAWVIIFGAHVFTAIAAALFLILVLGMALTAMTVLLLVIPVFALVLLMNSGVFSRRRMD